MIIVDNSCFPIDELDNLLEEFDAITDVNPETEHIVEIEPDFIHTNKHDICWVQKPFKPPNINLDDIDSEYIDTLKTPIQFFLNILGMTFLRRLHLIQICTEHKII